MRIRPILFNRAMVRVILRGKSVTRRPMQWVDHHYDVDCKRPGYFEVSGNDWACKGCGGGIVPITGGSRIHAPYCVGDILYVRETWCLMKDQVTVAYQADYPDDVLKGGGYFFPGTNVWVEAPKAWKPSIHMPREYARIFLEVTGVRAERLHSITDAEAELEGFEDAESFIWAWESIYKNSALDPWVWVISFRRVENPGDAVLKNLIGGEDSEE